MIWPESKCNSVTSLKLSETSCHHKKSCGQTSKQPPDNHGWSQASDRHGQLDIHRRHCMAFSMQSLLQGHLVLMPLVWARHSELHCDKDKGRNFAEKAHLVNETHFVGTFWPLPPSLLKVLDTQSGGNHWLKFIQFNSLQVSSNVLRFGIFALLNLRYFMDIKNLAHMKYSKNRHLHCTFQLSLFLMDLFVSTHHHLSPVLSYVKFPFLQDCDAGSHGTRGARRIQ